MNPPMDFLGAQAASLSFSAACRKALRALDVRSPCNPWESVVGKLPTTTGWQPVLPGPATFLENFVFQFPKKDNRRQHSQEIIEKFGQTALLSILALVKARAQRRYPQRSRPGGYRRASAKADATLPGEILIAFQQKAPPSLQNPSEAEAFSNTDASSNSATLAELVNDDRRTEPPQSAAPSLSWLRVEVESAADIGSKSF